MKYKWTVEFEVSPEWVADGFNLTDERAHEMILSELPFARASEVSATVKKSPKAEDIRKEQGYE